MFLPRLTLCCITLLTLSLCPHPLWAQRGGTGGVGGTSSAQIVGGGQQQQTSNFGAAGGGGRATSGALGGGGRAAGGAGGAAGQFGPTANFGENLAGDFGGGTIANESGFVGRNDNASRFIGSGRTAQGGGGVQAFQTPQFGNRNAGRGGGNNNFGQQQRNLRIVRPQLRVAFSHPTIAVSEVRAKIETQLTHLSERRQLEGIGFALDDESNVTLSGEAPSENARKLAEMLVRLEPGVRDVRNEITVSAAGGDGTN